MATAGESEGAGHRAVHAVLHPLARSRRVVAPGDRQCPKRQRDRPAEHQQHRHQHREHHVVDHVDGEHRRRIASEPRRGRDQQRGTPQHPRHRPADRPCVAALVQPPHPAQVDDTRDDGRRAEDQVEAPIECEAGQRRRAVKAISERLLHRRDIGRAAPRRRWSVRQRHRDPVGDREDEQLDEPEAHEQRPRRIIVVGDLATVRRRCNAPSTPNTTNATTLATTMRP